MCNLCYTLQVKIRNPSVYPMERGMGYTEQVILRMTIGSAFDIAFLATLK